LFSEFRIPNPKFESLNPLSSVICIMSSVFHLLTPET
jgi:hypothetical protein